MRYRKLDANGDMVFGHGAQDYFINVPAAVGQAVKTALLLIQGEWFLDNTAGVPWLTQVMGYGTTNLYDSVIQSAIRNVKGVVDITAYSSSLVRKTRQLSISATITTLFGTTAFTVTVGV